MPLSTATATNKKKVVATYSKNDWGLDNIIDSTAIDGGMENFRRVSDEGIKDGGGDGGGDGHDGGVYHQDDDHLNFDSLMMDFDGDDDDAGFGGGGDDDGDVNGFDAGFGDEVEEEGLLLNLEGLDGEEPSDHGHHFNNSSNNNIHDDDSKNKDEEDDRSASNTNKEGRKDDDDDDDGDDLNDLKVLSNTNSKKDITKDSTSSSSTPAPSSASAAESTFSNLQQQQQQQQQTEAYTTTINSKGVVNNDDNDDEEEEEDDDKTVQMSDDDDDDDDDDEEEEASDEELEMDDDVPQSQHQEEAKADGDRAAAAANFSDKMDEEDNKIQDEEEKDNDKDLPCERHTAATASSTPKDGASSPDTTLLPTATAVIDTTVTRESEAGAGNSKLTDQELIVVANKVFGEAELETFTMKHIFNALVEKQGGIKLSKQQKDTVRKHIQDLLTKQAKSEEDQKDDEGGKHDGEDKDDSDEQGSDDDSSEAASEQGDEMSEYENEDEDDDDDDDFGSKSRPKGRKSKATLKDKRSKKKKTKSGKKKKHSLSSSTDSLASSSKKKPSMRKAARAARMLEQQRLRKKRMEELRVRNEEMLLNQSKEDQERQDAIAAKFETNTDELRMKRLEDRLDLLQRLDEKRISVVAPKTDSFVVKKEATNGVGTTPNDKKEADTDGGNKAEDQQKLSAPNGLNDDVVPAAINTEESESSDDESSDEEDLVIIGMTKPFKPLKKLHSHLPSRGISILEQIQSPKPNKPKNNDAVGTVAPLGTSPSSRSATVTAPPPGGLNGKKTDGLMMSPNRSIGARFALRNALKKKQRMAGNQWLARELGYKSEQDHLKDCQTAAAQKRELVIRLEQERLKANERKNLRERILLEEAKAFGVDTIEDGDEDGDDQNVNSDNLVDEDENLHSNQDEEEDEEMQMAKEIEQEANGQYLQDRCVSNDKDSNSQADGETDEEVARSSIQVDAEIQANESDSDFAAQAQFNLAQEECESQATSYIQTLESQPLGEHGSEVLVTDNLAHAKVKTDTLSNMPGSETGEFYETQPLFEAESSALAKISEEQRDEHAEEDILDKPVLPKQPPAGHYIQDMVDQPGKEAGGEQATEEEATEEIEGQLDSSTSNIPSLARNSDKTPEDASESEDKVSKKYQRPRNAGWQAMLQREAEKLKKMKRRKGDLVEEEAEEEEEEEVAGLEDFGFTVSKKKQNEDDEDSPDADKLDEDDLEHVVDDLSDDEGDEDAGREARKLQEQREEKERHKEMIRRLKEGYDGRRGGIAGGGAGARGMHRFDQLVAADNREDAKRLGLLNDDELDSDDEGTGGKGNSEDDEEEDEAALVDKMLKDRHLHRTDVDFEENFSDDEEESDEQERGETGTLDVEDEEERSQDILAKRFAKRARMQRIEEMYGESQEFSQRRLIDEDESMKEELSQMRNGLVRHRSISSTISRTSQSSDSNMGPATKKRRGSDSDSSTNGARRASSLAPGSFFRRTGGSLSIALQASRKNKRRSTFLGGPVAEDKEGTVVSASFAHNTVAMSSNQTSRNCIGPSYSLPSVSSKPTNKKTCSAGSTSLFSRVYAGNGKA